MCVCVCVCVCVCACVCVCVFVYVCVCVCVCVLHVSPSQLVSLSLSLSQYLFLASSLSLSFTLYVELLRRLALKLLAPLRWGSNPMRGSCQLLHVTEGCWFTPRNKMFLQLWQLTAIYNQIRLKSGVNTNSPIHLHKHVFSYNMLHVNVPRY